MRLGAYLRAPTPQDSLSVPSDRAKCHSDRAVRPLRCSRRRPRRADHHCHPGAVGRRGAVRAWMQAHAWDSGSSQLTHVGGSHCLGGCAVLKQSKHETSEAPPGSNSRESSLTLSHCITASLSLTLTPIPLKALANFAGAAKPAPAPLGHAYAPTPRWCDHRQHPAGPVARPWARRCSCRPGRRGSRRRSEPRPALTGS